MRMSVTIVSIICLSVICVYCSTVHLLALFRKNKTPTNTGFCADALQRTPASKDKEIKETVDRALQKARALLQTFLRKNDLCDSWGSSYDDPRVVYHLAKLRIPLVAGHPRLLLHDLGGKVVEPRIVDDVFKQSDTCVRPFSPSPPSLDCMCASLAT